VLIDLSVNAGDAKNDRWVMASYNRCMAKPVRRASNDVGKREQILQAARKLIARYGFEGTSTKTIAAEAGVPSGLVFYYFETKDDLIEALFGESPRLVEDAIRKAQDRPQPLEAFLRALYDDMVEYRHLAQIIVAAIASEHPIAQKALLWRQRSRATVADFLRSLSTGKPSVTPEALARVVMASLVTEVLLEDPKDAPGFIRGLASVVRCGLAPPA
jgi:AcrR family transcriptional regulator